jgi:hypothetical protein
VCGEFADLAVDFVRGDEVEVLEEVALIDIRRVVEAEVRNGEAEGGFVDCACRLVEEAVEVEVRSTGGAGGVVFGELLLR